MKSYFFLFSLVLVFLFSCKKDKDNPAPAEDPVFSPARLEGTWRCTKVFRTELDSTNRVVFQTEEQYLAGGPNFNFKPQGILEEGNLYLSNFKATATGTYSLSGRKITSNIQNAQILYSGTLKIDTLTANRLSMADTIYNYGNSRKGFYVTSIKAVR